jgi:hypothetical protein
MRTIVMREIVQMALAGKDDVLAEILAAPHIVVADWWADTNRATPAVLGSVVPSHADEVIREVLIAMATLPSPSATPEARARYATLHEKSDPNRWYGCLRLLFEHFPPPNRMFELSMRMKGKDIAASVEHPAFPLLYSAIRTGRPEIIDLCAEMSPIADGRCIRISDAFDPLCLIDHGVDLLKFILDHPSIRTVPDPRNAEIGLGRVALLSARHGNLKIVRELAGRGVDFSGRLSRGDGVWGFSAEPCSTYDARTKCSELSSCFPILLAPTVPMLAQLEELGADITVTLPGPLGGEGAIFFALRTESMEVLRYLVEQRGFDVNVHNDEGATPLHYAVCAGTLEQVQYLLDHGAKVGARDHAGWTPLKGAFSSREGMLKVRLLIERGANIFERNFAGESELGSIGVGKHVHVAAKIVQDALTSAASDELAKKGFVPPGVREVMYDFLVNAIRKKQFDLAFEFMKDQNWWPDAVGSCSTGPAHAFIEAGGASKPLARRPALVREVIDLALAKGMGLEDRDRSGKTMLMQAVASKNVDAIGYLVELGADCTVRTEAGKPLESLTRDSATRSALMASITAIEVRGALTHANELIESAPPSSRSVGPAAL